MVKRVYLATREQLREYLISVKSEGEERAYRFANKHSGGSRHPVISYLRYTDDQERVGISFVSVFANRYPGKRPFFTHKALYFAFWNKVNKKLNCQDQQHLISILLKDCNIVLASDIIKPFLPMNQSALNTLKTNVRGGWSNAIVATANHLEKPEEQAVFSYNFKYYKPRSPRVNFTVSPNNMLDFVELVLRSKVVIRGILKGNITTFKEALKVRFRTYPCGKFTNRELTLLFMAFGGRGLTFLPYISTDTTGLIKLAEYKLRDYTNIALNNKQAPHLKRITNHSTTNFVKYYKNLDDLIDMSTQLGRKINFGWSHARMKEEHDDCVNRLTAYKLKAEPLVELDFEIAPPEIEGFEILQDSHAFVRESVYMNHCVGTSSHYFNSCVGLKSMVASITSPDGERATAEYRVSKHEGRVNFRLVQLQGPRNNSVSDALKEFEKESISTIYKTDFPMNFLKVENDHAPVVSMGVWRDNDDLPF